MEYLTSFAPKEEEEEEEIIECAVSGMALRSPMN